MKQLPWFRCYPEKWLGALQAMPPDLGYTYLIVCFRIYEKRGPIGDDTAALARRTGFRESHVKRLVEKLCDLGKLRRDAEGRLMNPFAEAEITDGEAKVSTTAEKRSTAAKIRWGKTQSYQQNGHANALQTDADLDSDKEKEKEGSKKKTPAVPPEGAWPSDYAIQFWNAYPRKTEKKAALAKLDAIRKSGTVPWPVLFAGVQRLAAKVKRAATEERYIKHPTTWLNRGCWDDQESPPTQPPQGPTTNGHARVVIDHLTQQYEAQAEEDRRHATDARRLDFQPTLPAHGRH